jgi:uncharacterized protein (TIGR00156 family)
MKKYAIFVIFCLVAAVTAVTVFAQQGGGFTGPSAPGTNSGQEYQAVSVSQLQTLNAKSYVTLTGNITQSTGRGNYTFRDASGEITVEIDRHYWWGLSVGPSDRVQLLVEVEKKRNGKIDVEAKGIRKL